MSLEIVTVWDQDGRKQFPEDIELWDEWGKCRTEGGQKRFPNGLVDFLEHRDGCHFPFPSQIQANSWPILMSGKDLIGVAKTGSGKTIGFLLPGFIWLRKAKKTDGIDTNRGPAILVMTPTRELCNQIYLDAEKFGKPVGISAARAYGGEQKRIQEDLLRKGPDTLIATPGRLNDFLESGKVSLRQCGYAVLDEADRMLDMGFEPQINKILGQTPEKRQTAMFTATWPNECKRLASRYIRNPVHIQVGSTDLTANRDVEQNVEICQDDREKMQALKRILSSMGQNGQGLVFCATKRTCRTLGYDLGRDAVELHGDLDQSQRDEALMKFKKQHAKVMVATDVCARGLDIRTITHVINYDPANNLEDHIHRIGRTGRAGDRGEAFTLLKAHGDERKAKDIMQCMENVHQQVPQDLVDLVNGRYRPNNSSGGGSGWDRDSGRSTSEWGASDRGGNSGWDSGGGSSNWKDDKQSNGWSGDHSDRQSAGSGDWSAGDNWQQKRDDEQTQSNGRNASPVCDPWALLGEEAGENTRDYQDYPPAKRQALDPLDEGTNAEDAFVAGN